MKFPGCTILAFLAISASAWAQTDSAPTLEVVSWKGEVRLADTDLEEGRTYRIAEGTEVITGEEGNLFCRYPDGSQLRIKEDTILDLGVIDPVTEEGESEGESEDAPKRRTIELRAGTIEYLADPTAVVDLRVATRLGIMMTRDADVSVRIDGDEAGDELSCVIIHNVDHTSVVEGKPDVHMSILKDDVEVTGRASGIMNPGSILVLCPRIKRTFNELTRHSIEISTDAVPIVRVQEASPFRDVLIFDF